MRSLQELEDIIDDDFITATALLENRPLSATDVSIINWLNVYSAFARKIPLHLSPLK